MYAKRMITQQISEIIDAIHNYEISESFIFDISDKILPQIEKRKNQPMNVIYPVLFINTIHDSVHDNDIIRKFLTYVIPGSMLKRKMNYKCQKIS